MKVVVVIIIQSGRIVEEAVQLRNEEEILRVRSLVMCTRGIYIYTLC